MSTSSLKYSTKDTLSLLLNFQAHRPFWVIHDNPEFTLIDVLYKTCLFLIHLSKLICKLKGLMICVQKVCHNQNTKGFGLSRPYLIYFLGCAKSVQIWYCCFKWLGWFFSFITTLLTTYYIFKGWPKIVELFLHVGTSQEHEPHGLEEIKLCSNTHLSKFKRFWSIFKFDRGSGCGFIKRGLFILYLLG